MNLTEQEAINLARWCAKECERQGAGPLAVPNMMDAALYAYRQQLVTAGLIITLGYLVDHTVNGFRQVPVTFADTSLGVPHEQVPRAIDNLVGAAYSIDPADFYWEFESIHPFVDGNGRVGAILYNLLSGYRIGDFMAPPRFRG